MKCKWGIIKVAFRFNQELKDSEERGYVMQNRWRIDWVDVARGYGILCVIVAHCEVGRIGTWMYTFHLPLFFIISGYLFTYKEDCKLFLKRKIKSMIGPYFYLGIPMIVFSFLIKGNYTIQDAMKLCASFILQRRMWTLWFLTCLFCTEIVFYFIVRYCKTTVKIGVCCIALTILGYTYYYFGGIPLPWNFDASLMAISFFYVGYFCKLKQSNIDKYFYSTEYSILLFLLFGVLNIGLAYFNIRLGFSNLEMFNSQYGFLPLVYGAAICGSFSVIIISRWFNILPIRYLGKNSLLYFAWHQTIFQPLCTIGLSILGWEISDITSVYEMIVYKIVYIGLILITLTFSNIIISKTKLKFML